MKTGVKVIDAMTHSPVVVKTTDNLQKCAKIMLKKNIGNVLVMKNEKLKGIITEKDLVRDVVATHLNPKTTTAEEIMTKKIKTISPNKDIVDAMEHMKSSKIRKLPVVFKKNVIGIITEKDIIKIQPAILEIIGEKGKMQKGKKQKYIEGKCDSCESYSQLYEVDGEYLCEECLDEKGITVKDE